MIKEKNNNFENLDSSKLKEILKSLKLYKDLYAKLGNRGKKLFHSIYSGESIYRVEFFENISELEAMKEALRAYKKIFGDSPKTENIVFEKKKSLAGGIRIYKDDNMSDLSFKKIENILI